MKDDRVYLRHILECAERVTDFARDGREHFLVDRRTQDAVLRNLQTLAESAQRLSAPLKSQHPEVDWRAIGGFRNTLVHNYLGINLERVWGDRRARPADSRSGRASNVGNTARVTWRGRPAALPRAKSISERW